MKKLNQFFNARKDYGIIFLRLVIGCRLIVAVWGVVFSWQNMLGVKDFFQSVHIPIPMISAVVAVFAEFICGILYTIGLWVRYAALLMIINFIVAISFVDVHNNFEKAFPAWVILAASVFFLFYGAGKISIDEQLNKRITSSN